MEIRNRSAKKRNRTEKCAGCRKHAAMCDAIFLGTEFVPLCSGCKKVWIATYENALAGFPDKDRELVAA